MVNDRLPTFDSFEEEAEDFAKVLGMGARSTATIDLDTLFSRSLTTSGSFDIKSAIWATTFGKLMETLPIPGMLIDEHFSVLVANEACKRFGDGYEKIVGRPFLALVPDPTASGVVESLIKDVFSTRKPRRYGALLTTGTEKLWGRMTFRSVRIGKDRLALVLIEDLTAEKKRLLLERRLNEKLKQETRQRRASEEALQKNEEMLRDFLDNATDLIQVVDIGGRFLFVNRAWKATLNYSDDDIGSLAFLDIVHPDNRSHCKEVFQRVLSGETVSNIEVVFLAKDGKAVEVQGNVNCRYMDGKPALTRGIFQDITDRKLAEKQKDQLITEIKAARDALQFQATHDELTDLWNRSAILDTLKKELARSSRGGMPVGIIMADLDQFKEINDSYGHLAGDAVLREVSRSMVACVRSYDSVGRYGGEEFLIVLPGCDRNQTRRMAERLRMRFHSNPIETSEGVFEITMSCGATAREGSDQRDVDSVIRAADEALYRAKGMGRNRVEIDDGRPQ
jgi:diguanylate cyclase (GGDEF)-like protein/PAS domain S-box-containing protein